MDKRSLRYMLEYIVYLAEKDPEATVIFTVSTLHRARFVFAEFARLVSHTGAWRPNTQALIFEYSGGGKVRVLPTDVDLCNYGGIVCTHMWLDDDLTHDARTWMPSRVRTNKQHVIPSGVFDAYGVVRRVDY